VIEFMDPFGVFLIVRCVQTMHGQKCRNFKNEESIIRVQKRYVFIGGDEVKTRRARSTKSCF
jgi:hypothetical protein